MIKSKINKSYFSERFLFSITQPSFVYKQKKKSRIELFVFIFSRFFNLKTEHLSSDYPQKNLKDFCFKN